MSYYNPLSWQNENALSNYPLEESFEVSEFIVDASFVQFNGFIPILNYVVVDVDSISFSITFDYGTHTTAKFYKSSYLNGDSARYIKIYQPVTDRYLGTLTLGIGAGALWDFHVSRKILSGKSFLPQTVRSIRSTDAVYLLDGMYGDIELTRTIADSSIFYNIYEPQALDFKVITFNAVDGHAPKYLDPGVLRKINLVGPSDNNINLASNDVIKITPSEDLSYLSIGLVSGSPVKSFSVPTLIS